MKCEKRTALILYFTGNSCCWSSHKFAKLFKVHYQFIPRWQTNGNSEKFFVHLSQQGYFWESNIIWVRAAASPMASSHMGNQPNTMSINPTSASPPKNFLPLSSNISTFSITSMASLICFTCLSCRSPLENMTFLKTSVSGRYYKVICIHTNI